MPSATTWMFRLRAMATMALTMAWSDGSVTMSRTKLRSIFSESTRQRFRYDNEEYPVPKSSMAIFTPRSRRLASASSRNSPVRVSNSEPSVSSMAMSCGPMR